MINTDKWPVHLSPSLEEWEEYNILPADMKRFLAMWIKLRVRGSKNIGPHSSYGLKHRFADEMQTAYGEPGYSDGSPGNFYVTNGQFKAAMVNAGYLAYRTDGPNFIYKIRKLDRLDGE